MKKSNDIGYANRKLARLQAKFQPASTASSCCSEEQALLQKLESIRIESERKHYFRKYAVQEESEESLSSAVAISISEP